MFRIITDICYFIYEVYVNFVNSIAWFNLACSGAVRKSKIKSSFSPLSPFLPLSSLSLGPYLLLPYLLPQHSRFVASRYCHRDSLIAMLAGDRYKAQIPALYINLFIESSRLLSVI